MHLLLHSILNKSTVLLVVILVVLVVVTGLNATDKTVGLVDDMLSQCPDKANCVCSERVTDKRHYIEPINFKQKPSLEAIFHLHKIIQEMGGNVHVVKENYLAATFTSAVFRFVDDLELRVDFDEHVIHVRSASRVGYSDFGVNKKRVETLIKLFNNKVLGT